jgi:hypothetical protein
MTEKHLSSQFDSELNRVSARVMELGGLVESQIRQAVYALSRFSIEAVEQVDAAEKRVNAMEVEIDHDPQHFAPKCKKTRKWPYLCLLAQALAVVSSLWPWSSARLA